MPWVCKKCGGEVVAHTSYTVTYIRPINKEKSRPIVSMKNETKFNLTREKNFGFVAENYWCKKCDELFVDKDLEDLVEWRD
ncbi:hypothetical protein H3N56_10330 [Cetobacterium sp. 2A]|uniref:hypothetical protein n=1 Tax=Cetobacterium sp. 2A TaxID=2754723 RepID=UPI00163CB006|nr:hypothetical protein [Cetobacterium sp. 2A]MBC2856796.1 hypothetical protein [Cetobacterium sp. 2A]MBC2856837.1 hypothetical protein [Cetobacterium sp. 2A]